MWCQAGRWRESIIGVPVAVPIRMWAGLCQLSMEVEKPTSSSNVSTPVRSAWNGATPMSRNCCSVKGSMAGSTAGPTIAFEVADHAVVEQQEAVAAGVLGVPVVVDGRPRRRCRSAGG